MCVVFYRQNNRLSCKLNKSVIYIEFILGGSNVKEFACNAGDPGLILGSGRHPGEGIGYPL